MEVLIPILVLCLIIFLILVISVFTNFPYETEDSGIITYVKQWSVAISDTLGTSLVMLGEHFWLYVPLGIIGLWRWLTWGVKKTCAEYYKPIEVSPTTFSNQVYVSLHLYIMRIRKYLERPLALGKLIVQMKS